MQNLIILAIAIFGAAALMTFIILVITNFIILSLTNSIILYKFTRTGIFREIFKPCTSSSE